MSTASNIRKKIMKQRGVEFKKLSRKPVKVKSPAFPAPYKKTRLMELLELRFQTRIEDLIFKGSIYDVEKRLGVDATTISKWRTFILKEREKEFFDKFKE